MTLFTGAAGVAEKVGDDAAAQAFVLLADAALNAEHQRFVERAAS